MSLPVSVDSLKSTIGNRGGLARGNRFAIYMSYPGGPGLLNTNPLSLLTNIANDGFNVHALVNDPRDIFLLCESVQIPGKRIVTMDQFHTHFSVKRPYTKMTDEVTCTFLLTNDYYIRKYFDNWQEQIVDSQNSPKIGYLGDYATDVIIQQISSKQEMIPGYQIKLINAFPLAVGAIELSNVQENSVLQVMITFAYDTWESTGIIDSAADLIGVGSNIVGNTIDQIL